MTETIKSDNTQVILNLQKQSAVAELTIQKMREALQLFVDRCDNGEVRSTRTYAQFKDILAISISTTYLDQYIQDVVLVERDNCAKACSPSEVGFIEVEAWEYEKAIRSRKQVKET